MAVISLHNNFEKFKPWFHKQSTSRKTKPKKELSSSNPHFLPIAGKDKGKTINVTHMESLRKKGQINGMKMKLAKMWVKKFRASVSYRISQM